eukprot:g7767.t1
MGFGSVVALVLFLQNGGAFTGQVGRVRSPRQLNTALESDGSNHGACWGRGCNLDLRRTRVLVSSTTEETQTYADSLSGDGEPLTRQEAKAFAHKGAAKLTRNGNSSKVRPRPLGRIVLVAGFEAFNLQLYKQVADELRDTCPELELVVFTDRDVLEDAPRVAEALEKADAFFASLVFDYDNVKFLKDRIQHIPVRLVFESALELMSSTSIGEFSMAQSGKGPGGPPAPVKALLSKFGSGKEEDKLAGYLKLLKVGPSLLKFVPGKKAKDLRSWLEIYSYWNQGGAENVLSMFLMLGDRYLLPRGVAPAPGEVQETPTLGLFHPSAGRFFSTPKEYLGWYEREQERAAATGEGGVGNGHQVAPAGSPRVAVLLYRKHVVTKQGYISQMIRMMEKDGLLPVPIFINGVEAHTVVRDLLTSPYEQRRRAQGIFDVDTLSSDCAEVDAVVNTIGFPLVGGPAGSMEAGRRVDVATNLLSAKDVPYMVAAPLLIQDLKGWRRDGVQGLQQVVLYSLPELDGAIDTMVLGGLVGDTIGLVPERVRKMNERIKGWVNLRRTPLSDRKVAVIVYGFPPNVGAVGTAALLNVPASLEKVLKEMKAQGYDLGNAGGDIDGEALVAALKVISQDSVVAKGFDNLQRAVDHAGSLGAENSYRIANPVGLAGGSVAGEGKPAGELEHYLSRRMAKKIEANWGDLSSYRGVSTSGSGDMVVAGLELGNVFIGVQPLLGLEGDPMRLMFERDLTPHPQYAAFYQWLKDKRGFGAQAVVHLGMHGTVEWLPGSPLGNTHETWPDVLLGGMPNVYVYAANNPSESILAKRRGYGTIISHNVPPYARAGLYKQLATLKDLVREFREDAVKNASLRPVIAANMQQAGLYEDLPYSGSGGEGGVLTPEAAEELPVDGQGADAFVEYARELSEYLQTLEQRLFSEGLHTIGHAPTAPETEQYLAAYFGDDLPHEVVHAISHLPAGSSAQSAAAAVRALGPRYSGVAAVDSGIVDVLTRLEKPGEAGGAEEGEGSGKDRLEEEMAHEQLLFGMEYIRWGWLRLLRQLGNKQASEAINRELDAMSEIGRDQNNPAGEPSPPHGGHEALPLSALAGSDHASGGGAGDGGALGLSRRVAEAVDIKALLEQNTDEVDNLMRALEGSYVKPGVGGDLLRDGAGVLPTGRNMHALDPYRMPSPAAWIRGSEAARLILEAHVKDTGGFPETVAVMMWGLDAIKTRGESVAIALALVGARPVKEGTGRVVKYELVPLSELKRPRIDVLASLSGIFRDSFANVVDLLDDLFETAAAAEEPIEMNFIRKHTLELAAQGVDRPSARLFSNPAGDFGSMVGERVGSSDWEDGNALGQTWQDRNAFSYGRRGERGRARPEVLQSLLANTERIVQEIDSVEYGLTDIQEYYANTGALKKAAETAQARSTGHEGEQQHRPPKRVGVSVVEAYGKDVQPRELESTLRIEYRSKLLNPKWAEAMANQGSGGAFEVSQRMTALIGWSGTTGFMDEWVYDGAAETYALDDEMSAKLRKSNPEAFQNVLKRLLEAKGRGYWDPDDDVLERIQQQYADVEDDIELGTGGFLNIEAKRQQAEQDVPSADKEDARRGATTAAAAV